MKNNNNTTKYVVNFCFLFFYGNEVLYYNEPLWGCKSVLVSQIQLYFNPHKNTSTINITNKY